MAQITTPTLPIKLLNAFQDASLPVASFISGAAGVTVALKTPENAFQANSDKVQRYKAGKKLDD
jgi:hypothetical protein